MATPTIKARLELISGGGAIGKSSVINQSSNEIVKQNSKSHNKFDVMIRLLGRLPIGFSGAEDRAFRLEQLKFYRGNKFWFASLGKFIGDALLATVAIILAKNAQPTGGVIPVGDSDRAQHDKLNEANKKAREVDSDREQHDKKDREKYEKDKRARTEENKKDEELNRKKNEKRTEESNREEHDRLNEERLKAEKEAQRIKITEENRRKTKTEEEIKEPKIKEKSIFEKLKESSKDFIENSKEIGKGIWKRIKNPKETFKEIKGESPLSEIGGLKSPTGALGAAGGFLFQGIIIDKILKGALPLINKGLNAIGFGKAAETVGTTYQTQEQKFQSYTAPKEDTEEVKVFSKKVKRLTDEGIDPMSSSFPKLKDETDILKEQFGSTTKQFGEGSLSFSQAISNVTSALNNLGNNIQSTANAMANFSRVQGIAVTSNTVTSNTASTSISNMTFLQRVAQESEQVVASGSSKTAGQVIREAREAEKNRKKTPN